MDRPRRIYDEDGILEKQKEAMRERNYPPNPQNEQKKEKKKQKKKENTTTTAFYPKELKSRPRTTIILSGSVPLIPYTNRRALA
ncbi:MAG: hypothetical protein V1882_03390 [Candidatus Omnitrophota bacterium]